MATWAEVKSYISSNYSISGQSDSLLQLEFTSGSGRSQIVFIGGDDTLIFLKSPFARVGEAQPSKIFELAGAFGVTVAGDMYCLTHVMLTPTLDSLELDVPLAFLTKEADLLEKNLGLGDKF